MASLDFKLHKKQQEIFLSKARFKVCAAGRRGGKSYLSAVMLLIEALKEKNDFGVDLKNKKFSTLLQHSSKQKRLCGICLRIWGKMLLKQP